MAVAACFVLLAWMSVFVSATGRFELHLVRYTNKHGLDKSKDHCDSFFTLFRTTKCDFFFDIEINSRDVSGRGQTWAPIHTKTYHNLNTVNFGYHLNGVDSNPIMRHFSRWYGVLNLKVKVTDHDHITKHDEVDEILDSVHLQPDGHLRHIRRHGVIHFGDSHLQYTLRVTCDPHYFGNDCAKRCVPENDSGGHFRCNRTGARVCLPGWRGPLCRERDPCSPSPCLHGALCKRTHGPRGHDYVCRCAPHWQGRNCSERTRPCSEHGHCLHGGRCHETSNGTAVCLCTTAWTGAFCQQDRDECAENALHHPHLLDRRPPLCFNGGACVNKPGDFACHCRPGWTGPQCQHDVDECKESARSPCPRNATCENQRGGFRCLCGGRHCGGSVSQIIAKIHHLKRTTHRPGSLLVIFLVLMLLSTAVGAAAFVYWRRQQAGALLRLVVKSWYKDDSGDDMRVRMSGDGGLDFDNPVYRRADGSCLEPAEEVRTGMVNGAFVQEAGDGKESKSPRRILDDPIRAPDYSYSSLAEDGRQRAGPALPDEEDGYLGAPSVGDSEEKLQKRFNDPAAVPGPCPPPLPTRDAPRGSLIIDFAPDSEASRA